MRYLFKIILVSFLLSSCVKDKPQNPNSPAVQLTNAKKVYVINEGNFGSANSSITLYDTGNSSVIEDFYKTQNNLILGEVTQSINYFNSNYYIVVNNSNKIVVCNSQFKKTGQITGLTSPRYILPITNQKAYVSDLYANSISIIDLNYNLKIGSIPCIGKTEQMCVIYNKVFVTNTDKNYIFVINTLNDVIIDSIYVGLNASSLVVDKNAKLWVLSAGNKSNSVLGKLSKINPISNQIEFSINFNLNDAPNHLCFNKTKDTLYYLNNNIFKMNINDVSLPSNPIILKGNKNFYGLGINPNDYTIYACDAQDYISKSTIYIYDVNGNQKSFFKAGLISNGFYFE